MGKKHTKTTLYGSNVLNISSNQRYKKMIGLYPYICILRHVRESCVVRSVHERDGVLRLDVWLVETGERLSSEGWLKL